MIMTVTLNTAVDKLYSVDSLQPYEVMRVQEVINTAGGKGMNVSRVAALAGEKVTATGFVGGYNGALFKSLITQSGITCAFTEVSANTRCCINVRDKATNYSTEFLEPGSPVAEVDLHHFVSNFEKLLPESDVVTISGSMPKGVPNHFYAHLIALAKQAGKKVILDTSGAALKTALSARPTLIKPNIDEIRQLLDIEIVSREELIAAARQLHDGGIEMVAISLGKEGVLIVCDEGVYHGVTPDVSVINTVGCGDSMVAGFAVSIARGQSVPEMIRYAVGVSTANALTKETGSFRTEDLERLLPQITVEKLQ